MNNAFVNFILNIPVKIGLRKRSKKAGIKMKNVSNVTMKRVRIRGYEKGIEIEDASNLKGEDVNVE